MLSEYTRFGMPFPIYVVNVEWIFWALRHLLYKQNSLSKFGMVQLIGDLMREYSTSVPVLTRACRAIGEVARGNFGIPVCRIFRICSILCFCSKPSWFCSLYRIYCSMPVSSKKWSDWCKTIKIQLTCRERHALLCEDWVIVTAMSA
jgi:hypothetical protein